MAARAPYAARSLEDTLVVWLGETEGCMKVGTERPLPPPKACSSLVHGTYVVAQLHLLTVLCIVGFILILLKLIVDAKNQ